MMKKLNEQLNVDLKNGTWSLSTSDNNSSAGSNSSAGNNSGVGNNSGAGSNSGGGVVSTNPKSADYYNDYQTDEIESGTGKNINNNNTGDYSDYGAAEEDKATTQVTDYSDYGAAEENNDAAPTTSNAKTPTDNTKIPMATNSLTTLTKIELDIMQQNNPLVYKTAFDKLGAVEQKIVTDKLAAK